MKKDIFLSLLSGLLLILSFPNFNIWLFAWFAVVPLFLAIENQKPLKAFLISYLVGVLFFLGTIYWLIHVTLPGMILVVLYLAMYFGIFGLILSYIVHRTSYIVLLAPAIWVSLEWFRSTGPAGFGWVLLSHSQSYTLPIIQIADIVGAYGVSFLVVLVNYVVYSIIKNFRNLEYIIMPIIISSTLIFLSLTYGYFRLNNIFTGESLKVAVIQGNIPQAKKWDINYRDEILDKYETLTRKASRENPDLIIWPETAVPGYLETERNLLEALAALAKDIKRPILVGAPREDEVIKDKYYNSAILLLEDGRIADHYNKLHLVPFGEYIPLKKVFSFVEKFSALPIGDFSKGDDYTIFKFFIEKSSKVKDVNWRMVKKVKFSCLICFEDIFPGLARGFVKKGALFLVNITNDAWFNKSAAAYQHAQSSVFRAVENRVNMVRAANTGLSCFIDQKGEIEERVEANGENLFVDGFKSHTMTLAKTRTFYTLHGDLFVYICIFFSTIFLSISIVKNHSTIR